MDANVSLLTELNVRYEWRQLNCFPILPVSAVVYALWLRLPFGGIFVAWLWTLLGDLLGAGVTVATGMW